ncbi:MAG: hypothetical protein JXR49_04110 [Acidobacteria bacterium]|nr:hypothetical protein [Acidobacteriota bacterium]
MRKQIASLAGILAVFRIAGGILIASTFLPAQSLTFTSPEDTTTWQAGTTNTITWTIRAPNPSVGSVPVRLLYRISPGGTWIQIGRIEAFRQKYDWEIPASVSGKATIRAIWSLPVPITVNSPIFIIRDPNKRLQKSVKAAGRAPDYRIDSVSFQDGRSLNEGIMYHPGASNDMRLLVRIIWNKVPGRYGIQCRNHKLVILDQSSVMILNPATVPDPDGDGSIEMPVQFRVPGGLREGSMYSFRVIFRPSDADCDSNASNNERTFSTRLIRMGGNDLVVRIVEAGRYRPDGFITDNQLRVVYELMNVSGAESLRLVKARIMVEGIDIVFADERVENLPPGVWKRHSAVIHGRVLSELSGEEIAVVIVDPENEIEELREDNNRDGKRFRWN